MAYKIHRVDIDKEFDGLDALWRKGHETSLAAKFEWMYANNPAGPAKVWAIADKASRAWIGMISLFPRWFSTAGVQRKAGVFGDLFVLPDHRSLGPALMLIKASLASLHDEGFDFVCAFPSEKAEPVFRWGGFHLLGSTERFVRVCETAPYLEKHGMGRGTANLLGKAFDGAIRFLAPENWRAPRADCHCIDLDRADARFDELWRRSLLPFSVVGDRTGEFINWKYFHHPNHHPSGAHRISVLLSPNRDRTLGYLVYAIKGRSAEIRDIYASSWKTFDAVAGAFLRSATRLGLTSVWTSLLHNALVEKHLRRFWFLRARDRRNVYIAAEDPNRLHDLEANSGRWFLMNSDEDG